MGPEPRWPLPDLGPLLASEQYRHGAYLDPETGGLWAGDPDLGTVPLSQQRLCPNPQACHGNREVQRQQGWWDKDWLGGVMGAAGPYLVARQLTTCLLDFRLDGAWLDREGRGPKAQVTPGCLQGWSQGLGVGVGGGGKWALSTTSILSPQTYASGVLGGPGVPARCPAVGSSGCAGERLGAPLEEVAGGLGPRLRAAAWGPAQVTSVLESARGARHCNIQSWHLRGMLSLPLKVGVEDRVLFWGPRASPTQTPASWSSGESCAAGNTMFTPYCANQCPRSCAKLWDRVQCLQGACCPGGRAMPTGQPGSSGETWACLAASCPQKAWDLVVGADCWVVNYRIQQQAEWVLGSLSSTSWGTCIG